MICTGCKSEVPDGASFCPRCGTRTAAPDAKSRESRKTVTVLFCDMADSTALSGRLDPEPLLETMVSYYELMRACLERHGGTVEKYIGDAVVAVFGVPVLHEDDALRALRAATDMIDALDALNRDLRIRIGVEIGIRIGVNSGEVVVTEDAHSGQVLALGEAVNVAARLQQQAATGQVVLGPITHSLTVDHAEVVPIGELSLKGKAQKVAAWRLAGLAESPSLQSGDEAFFGRVEELEQLDRLLDLAVRTQTCQLVSIYGDPGIGKTRLATRFAAGAGNEGALVGAGRCPAYGEGRTFRALGEALRQLVDAARADGALDQDAGFDVQDALVYLESGLLRDGNPGELPDELVWAAASVLKAIGRRHPVIMIVDDLQWAKPVLLDVLERLADGITGAAVILLGLARPELLDTVPSWGGGRSNAGSLTLEPLSVEESRNVVASLLAEVSAHGPGLEDAIVERAEGSPFFIEQLVAIAHQGTTDSLPPTVQSVIAARLDLLQSQERDVLLRAAVPGRHFTTPELRALLKGEPVHREPPEPTLSALTQRRLIVSEHAENYRFSGALVRDAAYGTLMKRDRMLYHTLLAEWHRVNSANSDLVGLHLECAYLLAAELGPADRERVRRLRSEAAQALALAGTLALRRGDLNWAADLLARAQGLSEESSPGHWSISVRLAEAKLLVGGDPGALETLRVVSVEAERGGDLCAAFHARLLLAAMELPGPTAAEDALAAVPVFEAAGDDLGLTRAWLRVGQVRQLGGRYEEAAGLLRRALRHAVRTDTQFELATVIGALAISLWRGPTPVEEAVSGCRTLLADHAGGRRAVRATVNCPYAVVLAYRGEFDEARARINSSSTILEQIGHAFGAAAVLVFAATVEGLAGQWSTAERLLREAAAASAQSGDMLSSTAAAAGLARALLEQGRVQAAMEAAEGAAATGDPFLDAEAQGVRARAFAAFGDADSALREAARAIATADGTDSTVCRATARLDHAFVLHHLDRSLEAVAAAAIAEALYRSKGHLVGARRAAELSSRQQNRDGI